ncbi:PREDICTED: UPF0547 protein C16orf87 homolog [Chinchilla lanigera]|nr:PREDICTED: UPF0547 protein C16orf87 homolog [Chinchilla lanigera]
MEDVQQARGRDTGGDRDSSLLNMFCFSVDAFGDDSMWISLIGLLKQLVGHIGCSGHTVLCIKGQDLREHLGRPAFPASRFSAPTLRKKACLGHGPPHLHIRWSGSTSVTPGSRPDSAARRLRPGAGDKAVARPLKARSSREARARSQPRFEDCPSPPRPRHAGSRARARATPSFGRPREGAGRDAGRPRLAEAGRRGVRGGARDALPAERSMSATRAKKVKMATKSCPECDQQVPVACKSCPCGYIFISRKLLNAKHSEKSPSSTENKHEAKRRRTERVRREKINSTVNKDLENRKRSRSNSHSDHIRRGRGRPKSASAKKHEEEREKQEKEIDIYANLSDEKAFVFSVALAEINRKIINQRLIL